MRGWGENNIWNHNRINFKKKNVVMWLHSFFVMHWADRLFTIYTAPPPPSKIRLFSYALKMIIYATLL